MADLAATGSPGAEGPLSREDSAHDMAQGESAWSRLRSCSFCQSGYLSWRATCCICPAQGSQNLKSVQESQQQIRLIEPRLWPCCLTFSVYRVLHVLQLLTHEEQQLCALADARNQGQQQLVSSRLSEPQGRGLALDDSVLRTDSASEGATGLTSGSGLVRDSAVDGTPGLHTAHGRESSSCGRPAAERTSSITRVAVAGEGMQSMPAAHGMQTAGYARGVASEDGRAVVSASRQAPSARPISAFEAAPDVHTAVSMRDSATDETAGALAASGRRDSASEQLLAASRDAGASRLQEVRRTRTEFSGFHLQHSDQG